MAENTASGTNGDMDIGEHRETYSSFIHITLGTIIACVIILVSLAAIAVGGPGGFWVGIFGLIVGLAAVSLSMLANLSYLPSLGILALVILMSIVTL
jgi:hypothetical protein